MYHGRLTRCPNVSQFMSSVQSPDFTPTHALLDLLLELLSISWSCMPNYLYYVPIAVTTISLFRFPFSVSVFRFRFPFPLSVSIFRFLRLHLPSLLRASKTAYFQKLGSSNSKEFWKAVKLVNKQSTSIPALKDGSSLITTDTGKAQLLNEFFHSCFNRSFDPLSNPDPLDPSNCPSNLLCTENQITDLLLSLKTVKYTGPDSISATMLRSTAASIAPSLTKLFNLSIASGCFPTAWKCARVTPIFKSADPALPSNYRPISILPIVSKVLERHVYNLVPISAFQWGFMPKRSTTSALCTLTHDCLKCLDEGSEIGSVFFDLRKAFDNVPHTPLLDKLSALQLNVHLLQWIHSYLSNRSQTVVVGGEESSMLPVVSGGTPRISLRTPAVLNLYLILMIL